MKEFYVSKLQEVGNGHTITCPDCGNDLSVVSNGFFHGELFYCPKEKKVFSVYLRDITKGAGEDYLKQCAAEITLKRIRRLVTEKNMDKVEKLLGGI